jgi:hypothetical protein
VVNLSVLLFPSWIAAQSIEAAAGTSSLIGATGFEMKYKLAPVDGWFGLTSMGGMRPGGLVSGESHGYNISLGDQFYPFVLDTDQFERSQYFNARGLTVSHKAENESYMVFVGAMARDYSTSFAKSFSSSGLTGAAFYDCKLSPHLTFTSRNIFRSEITSIQSLGYDLRPGWKVAVSGGIGSNSPYGAIATHYKFKWVDATAAHIENGGRFQRIQVTSPVIAERTGPNLRVRLTPVSAFNMEIESEKIFMPPQGSITSQVASLNGITTGVSLKKFSLSGSYTDSHSGSYQTRSETASISRALGSRLLGTASLVQAVSNKGLAQKAYLGTVEETVSPRLSLIQNVSQSGGHTTIGYGARFLSNRLTFGVQYQTVLNPLASGSAAPHIYQAWMFSVALRTPRGGRLHYDNYVDAYGKVRYTAYADGFRYSRNDDYLSGSGSVQNVKFPDNVIRGLVQDESGNPVWGISVKIGKNVVYSDNSGKFFVCVKDRKEYPIAVLTAQSANPAPWEVVTAPASAHGESGGSPQDVMIVLRHSKQNLSHAIAGNNRSTQEGAPSQNVRD